jgi:P-type Cu+ transporter
MSYRMQI